MQIAEKEQRPVVYSASATKTLHFTHHNHERCFRMHWHDRLEILHIQNGVLAYTLGSTKGLLREGDVLIVPPKIAHYGVANPHVSYDVLMFDLRHFYNETQVCKQLLTAIFDGRTDFVNVVRDSEIAAVLDDICHAQNPDSLETVAKVYLLLHLLIDKHIVTIRKAVKDRTVHEIIQYIEQHHPQSLSSRTLCETFGYTPAHFCRKFKKSTGMSPLTYLKIYRLEKAFEKIQNSSASIGEIAEQCGFSDSNYFTRCFTAHYGKPPTHYRK